MKYICVLFRFQTYSIFYFSRRLFAEQHTLSSWCRTLLAGPVDRAKFGFCRFQSFLFIVVIVKLIFRRFCKKLNFDTLHTQFRVNQWWKFCSDRTRIKSLLRWLKNIGMVSQKLYRNTSSECHHILQCSSPAGQNCT